MRIRRAESLEELSAVLADYSTGHLFRGQAQHYTTDSGNPSIVSSFSRKGCTPETTRKWTFWAQLVLDLLGAPFDENLGMALMQHYGWRSFYVDVTSDTAVAAWFAAHKLQVTQAFDLPQHLSVVMEHEIGNYSLADGDVSLYVFNIDEVQRHGYSVENLATYLTDPSCRPVRQRAWAMGPLNRFNPTLNPSCIAARVVAPVSVMQGYAASHGLWSPADLFPPPERDFVLAFLEQQPWINTAENAYVRSFRYPNYHGAPRSLSEIDLDERRINNLQAKTHRRLSVSC